MSKNTSFGGFLCTVLAVIVGCGAAIGLKQYFDKDKSSENETSVESEINSSESVESEEENSSEDEQQTVITDLNFYSNPDNFTEVEVAEGERLAGNVYRFVKTNHDMDGDESNGFECYTIMSGAYETCKFLSSSYGDCTFGFNDTSWGETDPLYVWIKGPNIPPDVNVCVTIADLGITYNWVHTSFECYVDVYFAPGSSFTIEYNGDLYTLKIDELSWYEPMACVTRLVAKTS